MFDDDAFGTGIETMLRMGAAFDWLSPMLAISEGFLGQQPVHIPHDFRFMAVDILDCTPTTYDPYMHMWIFMVDNQQIAHGALEQAGIPHL